MTQRAIGFEADHMGFTGMTFRADADRCTRSSALIPSMRAPEPCKSWLVKVMFMCVPSDWTPRSVQAKQLARANRPPAANRIRQSVSKTVSCMFFPKPVSYANHLIRQRRGRVRQCTFRDRNRWLPARRDRQISTPISEIRAAVTRDFGPIRARTNRIAPESRGCQKAEL